VARLSTATGLHGGSASGQSLAIMVVAVAASGLHGDGPCRQPILLAAPGRNGSDRRPPPSHAIVAGACEDRRVRAIPRAER
ncbi:hypothetical protein AAHH78_37950, partial [Burkholderia pseudomallei]